MEIFLIKALQLMLALSILVLLHEGGHFFFSKLFGVRVEKFYLFFDPWFHLFEFKPKNSDTTYGMGWLPLGGYCKISGMIDESFDTEQMKQPEQPWEFRSKPAWQRLLIMIGGVLVNFVLALFIYSMILFHWGDDYVATKDMKQGMAFNSEAKALGFQDHDILVGTEEGEFKTYDGDMFRALSTAHRVDIIRNGKPMSLQLPGDINMLGMFKATPRFVEIYQPLRIDSVAKGTPAALDNFEVVADANGATKATLSWTNPTKTFDGQDLSAITNVKIMRDHELIATITDAQPGKQMQYVDNLGDVKGAIHHYTAYATNSVGNGAEVRTSLFIGHDIPSPVTDLQFVSPDKQNVILSWEQPTEGKTGGYVDMESLTYTVVRHPDEKVIATGLKATTGCPIALPVMVLANDHA